MPATAATAAFLDELAGAIAGEVRRDPFTRYLYSTDGSIYEIPPLGVAFPVSEADVVAAVRLAGRHGVALLPRGGGTSLSGQTVGEALILDLSRHMHQVLNFDPDGRRITVAAGAVCEAINSRVAPQGLRFAPDPSTANRATIGGMVGNNASGSHSIKYGMTADCTASLRVVLAGGEAITTGPLAIDGPELAAIVSRDTMEATVYRTVLDISRRYAADIAARYPDIPRNVSGYNLRDTVRGGVVDLTRLFCGSEGTLGIVTAATLRLEPLPRFRAMALLSFADLVTAMAAIMPLRDHDVSAIELIDRLLLDLALETPYRPVVESFPAGTAAVLAVEVEGGDPAEVGARAGRIAAYARAELGVIGAEARTEPGHQREIWNMRKAAVPMMYRLPGDPKPVPFIEDMAVPPAALPAYVRGLQALFDRHGLRSFIYAHASVGCLHVRPIIPLKEPDEVQKMARIAREACELVLSLGGAMSGEHGDGLARTQWNRVMYGERLWAAFRQVKAGLDPDGLLNPGKVYAESADLTRNHRYSAGYLTADWAPMLDFTDQGTFQQAVELCNGCGGCRKPTGTMCPTFRALSEEIMTTRGRANLVRGALGGRLEPGVLFTPEFRQQVLDYCIGCKGCRAECPSGVDMGKIKAEVLYHYNRRHGKPLRSRLLARVRNLYRLGSVAPGVANAVMGSGWFRRLLGRVAGLDPRRPLPPLAMAPFSARLRAAGLGPPAAAPGHNPRRVLIFPDCFVEYNHPGVGMAAVRVLERAGAEVRLAPAAACCGRPAVSEGLLDEARAAAQRNLAALLPYVEAGWDIVALEPSCTAAFRHELRELLGLDHPGARRLAEHFLDVTEYLSRLLDAGELDGLRAAAPPPGLEQIAFHGHCHQKSLRAHLPTARVLERLTGARVHLIDAGCCGMAGSFGYKREHADFSARMADLVREAIAQAGGAVVASGTSCTAQFQDLYGWQPLHPIEVLDLALSGPEDTRTKL